MKSNLELMQNVVKPYIDAKNQALTNKLEDEAETRAALGAHNFLKTTITSQTKNGITLTVNSDKSITVSTEAGGATETTVFNVCEGYSLKAGTYIYSGVPATGSSTTTYYLDMRTDTSSQFIIDSSRPEREITTAGQSGNDARLIVMSGVVITTPIVFKPMIRLATDADPTYQPYAKTNVELTQLGVYYNTSNDSISLPTGTEPEIINISNLPAGVYIVSAMVRGYPNTECDKYARVLSSNDSNIARIQGVSKIEDISISAVVKIPVNNGTISIKAYQNSGSTVTLNARLDIVRVG